MMLTGQRLRQWEHWPFPFFYGPLLPFWLRNYVRSGSLWYFTAANPTLTFGGFEGESKSEQYSQLPAHLCPRTAVVQPGAPLDGVLQQVQDAGIQFPAVAKPDVGMKGILVRKVHSAGELARYHALMPVPYLVQEYVALPLEVSVFYCRMPGAAQGTITGFIQKELLQVQGDGVHTLAQLVAANAATQPFLDLAARHWGSRLQWVPPVNEPVTLSHVANLVNGARFCNLRHLVDGRLLSVFDSISHQSNFYYGRYDIKCAAPTDLHKGSGFRILEFNGAGSVPNHVFAGTYSLRGAWAEVVRHWNLLHRISAAGRKLGHRCPGTLEGWHFMQRTGAHFKRLKALDKTCSIA